MNHPTNHVSLLARYQGSLIGLACGDALGTTVEFQSPGSFAPVKTITGGGVYCLPAGAWTDDTSMALCLAESLIEHQGFNPHDAMTRFCRWWREGHLSSTGRCFDIGNATRQSLAQFEQTGEAFSGSTDPHTAGNGSLMRLAPVPLFYALRPREAIRFAADSSRLTHAAREAVDACRLMANLLVGAIEGKPKDELLDKDFSIAKDLWLDELLAKRIAEVAAGSYKVLQPPIIEGTGYVVRSLEAALWAFYHTNDFCEGALLAVNLGDDADTTGAIYGQLAGTFYGVDGIPLEWRNVIAKHELIEGYATRLYKLRTQVT